MSTVRYSDTELWEVTKSDLDTLKQTLTMNEFSKWSISRLEVLIKKSTELTDWMDPDIKHLRNYRIKAKRFYEEKTVKENDELSKD